MLKTIRAGRNKLKKINFKILLVFLFFPNFLAHAQTQDGNITQNYVPVAFTDSQGLEDVAARIKQVKPSIDLNQIPSLFFTPSEQSLIAEARAGFTARPPTDLELRQAEQGEASVPMGPRELALGGIVYTSAGDWTIWLNGEEVTPKRLPPEILDIKVRKDYVRIRWFDAYTNQIFPIKIRSNQRFNIDTRIFLPGERPREAVSEY